MYFLSETRLKKRLAEKGIRNFLNFTLKNGLNRNALHAFLKGKSIFSGQFQKIASALDCDPMDLVAKTEPPNPAVEIPYQLQTLFDNLFKTKKDLCLVLFGSQLNNQKLNPRSDWDFGVSSVSGNLAGNDYLKLYGKAKDAVENLAFEIDFVNLDRGEGWFWEGFQKDPQWILGNKLAYFRLLNRIRFARG